MSNGVGVSRSQRKEQLLERISNAKNLIAAHTELADMIEHAEARSVSHQQIWNKVARRLRADAAELGQELERAEQRLFDISVAEIAHDNHIPVRSRVHDLIEAPTLPAE